MNKAELAAAIAERVGLQKKTAEDVVAAFQHIITEELANDRSVTIAGFGTFSSRVRAGRIGVNPQNPSEEITIPPVRVPKFKAGKALKDVLKGRREVGQSSTPAATPAATQAPAAPIHDDVMEAPVHEVAAAPTPEPVAAPEPTPTPAPEQPETPSQDTPSWS